MEIVPGLGIVPGIPQLCPLGLSSGELSEDDKKSTSELFAIFTTYCAPRKNVTIHRKLFYERKQSAGETIDGWVTQLRLIATDCEFHNQDEMIRDMIVLNSVNKKVQERLLETAVDE